MAHSRTSSYSFVWNWCMGFYFLKSLINSKSQWCHAADPRGENTGEAEAETGMCCCVCRWQWLEQGGNTEVMLCCEGRFSDQAAVWKEWGEERRLLWSELCWWQVQASPSSEPVEPQGQTGEKLLLNMNHHRKLLNNAKNADHQLRVLV